MAEAAKTIEIKKPIPLNSQPIIRKPALKIRPTTFMNKTNVIIVTSVIIVALLSRAY